MNHDASNVTLWQLLRAAAEKYPRAVLLIDAGSGEQLTFAETLRQSELLAAAFFARGVRAGAVVTWMLPTRAQTVLAMLALARIGAVQNPVIHLYRERELGAAIAQSRPTFLMTCAATPACDYPLIAATAIAESGVSAELIVLGVDVLNNTSQQADPNILPPAPTDAEAMRWIYCTSGTTSTPKGVLHTDKSLISGGRALRSSALPTVDDVGSVGFPFAHIGGVMYTVMMLEAGAPMVLIERFIPERVVAIFRQYGVTLGGGSTAHYQVFLAEQRKQPQQKLVPSLRILSGGGASKPPELFFDVKREIGCTVVHAYGMTEAPIAVTNTIEDSDEDLAYSDGKPAVGMQVRIVRDDGTPAPLGEAGEIRIRGINVCKGYLDAAQTAAAFDEFGFFRTGDIGVLSTAGRLSITGRIKDIIIRKGENISAKEIEDILYTHPKIAAVAVIGLPDVERGERVCAVVQLKNPGEPFAFAEMAKFLQDKKLMRQKIPEQLEILETLPRNEALNKILKYQLRERFANQQ